MRGIPLPSLLVRGLGLVWGVLHLLLLCSEKGSIRSGKSHSELVEETCFKQPHDKQLFACLRDHLQVSVVSMKCHMAQHTSKEATHTTCEQTAHGCVPCGTIGVHPPQCAGLSADSLTSL